MAENLTGKGANVISRNQLCWRFYEGKIMGKYKEFTSESVETTDPNTGEKYTYVSNGVKSRRKSVGVSEIAEAVNELNDSLIVSYWTKFDDFAKQLNNGVLDQLIKDLLVTGCAYAVKGANKKIIPVSSYRAYSEVDAFGEIAVAWIDLAGNGEFTKIDPKDITYISINKSSDQPFGQGLIPTAIRNTAQDLADIRASKKALNEKSQIATSFLLGTSPDNEIQVGLPNFIAIDKDSENQSPTIVQQATNTTDLVSQEKETAEQLKNNILGDKQTKIWKLQNEIAEEINRLIKWVSGNENYYNSIIWKQDITKMGSIGDAIGKINSVANGYFTEENLDEILGIKGGDIPRPITFTLDEVLNENEGESNGD